YFSGEGKNGKIQTVCFEGVLTINDAPALIDLLQQGIGPAKSMGCGLLSLAPL
ncbi:type I-E CRISPR-associated protein Cas6/Cse3/CasE, partial [Escherichia coli]|nr:type I-E CRISPR-associated protein Cas6/Cse3/CasE [Escherichia coli]